MFNQGSLEATTATAIHPKCLVLSVLDQEALHPNSKKLAIEMKSESK